MKNVKSILKRTAKLTDQQINESVARYGDSDSAWRGLLGINGLTETDVFTALADSMAIEFIDGRKIEVNADLISRVPTQLCREERIIPIEIRDDYLFIGTDDPTNLEAFDELQVSTNLVVACSVISTSVVNNLLNKYFRQDSEISELTEQLESVSEVDEDDLSEELGANDEDNTPIVRYVNLLLNQAIRDRASDVHVEPTETDLVVRYRIDGILKVMQRSDGGIKRNVIARLKVMSGVDTTERRKPQDGRFTVHSGGKNIDIRLTTLPTIWGEKIVMRILDSSSLLGDIKSLEMTPENEQVFRKSIAKTTGLVLITGPTGSGKSSSLYIALEEITDDESSIVTVENPVERKMKGIVAQMQVDERVGLTFASALRAIVRADPDIVLVGEIRDEETAKIAIDASMTGHLVLATLHTNGAPEAAARLVEMGVEPYLVGSTISCVVAQRLARRLCEDCKQPTTGDQLIFDSVGFPEELRGNLIYEPVGCDSCSDTGYKGRIALTEVMEMTESIERLVLAGDSSTAIRKDAEANGLKSLRLDGFAKVARGLTTIKEVLRVAN